MELESLVRNKNDITINVDATRVFKNQEIMSPFGGTAFAKKSRGSILDPLKRAEILQLYMKNSFEVRASLFTCQTSCCLKASRFGVVLTSFSFSCLIVFARLNSDLGHSSLLEDR